MDTQQVQPAWRVEYHAGSDYGKGRGVELWADGHNLFLPPVLARGVLNELRTTTRWRQEGFIIVSFPPAYFAAPGRARSFNPDGVLLSPDQARELLNLLELHEAALNEELKDRNRREQLYSLGLVFDHLQKHLQRTKAEKVDLTARSLSWTKLTASAAIPVQPHGAVYFTVAQEAPVFVCNHGSRRATVQLIAETNYWHACFEGPHLPRRWSPGYPTLEETLTQAEQRLTSSIEFDAVRAAEQASKPQQKFLLTPEEFSARHRKRLQPYWIEPAALAAMPVNYRIELFVWHIPTGRGSELSFGEREYGDEDFPAPAKLAVKLGLHKFRLEITPFNINGDGGYRITGLTSYADAALATAEASRLWEQCDVIDAFQNGALTGAQFGLKEVETGFTSWLGGIGAAKFRRRDRDEFMKRLAFRLTLAHALDVKGYRAHWPLIDDDTSDEAVLAELHDLRASMPIIPPSARSESKAWLRAHGHQDSKQRV